MPLCCRALGRPCGKTTHRVGKRQGLTTSAPALSNGTAESINATVQAAIVRARGFRTLDNLMTVIYLVAAKLTHLPKPPYGTPAIAVA